MLAARREFKAKTLDRRPSRQCLLETRRGGLDLLLTNRAAPLSRAGHDIVSSHIVGDFVRYSEDAVAVEIKAHGSGH